MAYGRKEKSGAAGLLYTVGGNGEMLSGELSVAAQHPQASVSALSVREVEVLGWLANGKTAWDISMILGIKERTVRFHIDNILKKLDAVNSAHAAALAVYMGLVDMGRKAG